MAIMEVVKYNGSPDVFAWKHPNQELGTWSQLIVNESQEAVLFKGGKALDLFESGTHTLSTDNIPILRDFIKLPFGGVSPFSAEVWYINKVHSLDIKWGTKAPVQLQDPKYKIYVPVRSFGQFGIQVEDSRKFLVKLVGTMPVFSKDNLVEYFRGLLLTKIKDLIATYLVHKQISILEISAYLEEISEYALENIAPEMENYGIRVVNFYINSINFSEEDEGIKQLKRALAKRAEMEIIGYDYTQERSFDTLEGAATNEGSMAPAMMGAGMGLGMGAGMGSAMGNMMQNINTSGTQKTCSNCNASMAQNQRFCGSCGFDANLQNVKPQEDGIKCSNCGVIMVKGSKFCSQCGEIYNPCPNCKADVSEKASVCPECGEKMPVSCPNCDGKVDAGAKFCSNCGNSMLVKCVQCANELAPGAKFCPECGTKNN